MEQAIEKLRKKDKKKNKARGSGKIGREMENKIHQQHEGMREKNKLLYKREYEKAKKEDDSLFKQFISNYAHKRQNTAGHYRITSYLTSKF